MAFSAETAHVLSQSLRGRDQQSLWPDVTDGHQDPEELVRAVHFHGVAAYVYDHLRVTGFSDDRTRNTLRALRDRNSFAHLRSLLDMRFLDETLGGAAIPWLIVKGPTLAAPIHGAAHLRSYSDLDAVVPTGELGPALDALTAAGARIRDRNWTLIRQEMKGEVHVELPSGTNLDLHWHLLNDAERRAAFVIDLDGLFERRVLVDVDGAAVPTLCPIDTLVYVCIHTIHSGGHRLIWLKDIERLLAQPDTDSGAAAARAAEWNASLVVLAALLRTELALGPLPMAPAMRAQLPAARLWEAVARRAWRAAPAAREDGTGSIGRVVARSVRTSSTASFANLAGRTFQHLRDRQGRQPDEASRRFTPEDPRSDRFPSGGPAVMRSYLDAVAGLTSTGADGRDQQVKR